VYHVGIIDYLTDFNFNKQVENWWKVKIKKRDPKRLSAIKPGPYSERFLKFMSQEVFINQNDPKYR